MSTNIRISLDARRKSSQTFPLVFRLTHNRRTTSIATGIKLKKSEWDQKNHKVRNSFKGVDSVTRLNNLLRKKLATMMDMVTRLEDDGKLRFMSLNEVRKFVTRDSRKVSLFDFTEKLINDMVKANRVGNARVYRHTLSAVRNFVSEKDITFQDLNQDFLQRFETWHLSKGNSLGGLSVYLRTLRAIYRKAIKTGLIEEEGYPFKNYTIRNGKPRKRAIPFNLLQKIKSLELEPGSKLYHDRHVFLMSFLLNGMSFTDMCHLKISNIIDGRIKYTRQKTNYPFDIKIDEQLEPILEYFIKGKQKEDYILSVIKHSESISQYKDVLWARSRYNKNLKKIGEMAGIEETLTSYVSRHSFATGADDLGVPVTAISQMLGHQKISTTEAYLSGLRTKKKDEYQDKILREFNR